APAAHYEDRLDRAREFVREEQFLVGVEVLSGALPAAEAGAAYSGLAEGALRAILPAVEGEFAREHGRVPGGRAAVLAMGKLGSREMTAASDLDMILVYDAPDALAPSDGPRGLPAMQYFARLTQRLVAALSAPTRSGTLYEVDLRLRPFGRKGPLATSFAAFADYQEREAETWEHMALTRARIVAGDSGLGRATETTLRAVLRRPRDRAALAADVLEMRALIAKERATDDPFDLKLVRGGLLDVEFAAQFVALATANSDPGALDVSTRRILDAGAASGAVDPDDARRLLDAHALYVATEQILRLSVEGRFDPATASSGLKRRVAAAAGLPDFRALVGALAAARAEVVAAFARVVRAVP
ncbi:MAG: bifunctional [glutamine synthetase] adenylyltransferase/[glutamine synthetase]-adenylyl-L-tyrosine phosphorylase, partial [Hyphomicrobiales bacterium]|nr:bifunctional [glutamine synthetase] adenylyltransferase/[glutamine synthetase]-adenylyl-L-tyrosine phosphorylase [Hyphomicrobiales bacterium]